MKVLTNILLLLILTISHVKAQLHLASSEQLFITGGDSLHFDGLTLLPTSNFILSNTTLTKNNTLTRTSPNPAIQRAYSFSNAPTGFTGSVRIDYLDAELNSIQESNLQMSIHNGSSWQYINTAASNSTDNFLTGNAISNMTLAEITLMSAPNILPVSWLSFIGKLNGASIALSWSTASESNVKEFIVEHSTDRNLWRGVGKVQGNFNSNRANSYAFEHGSPAVGNNFYRIIEVDFNGKTSKSQIVHVINAVKPLPLQAFPNPVANGIINIRLNQPSMVRIFGSSGDLLLSKQLDMGLQQVDIQNLKPGIYRLNVSNETISIIKL